MKYQIWIEEYNGFKEHSDVQIIAEVEADSFQVACDQYFTNGNHPCYYCGTEQYKDYQFCPLYNQGTLTYYGCRLFDNEADARKSFG